MSLKVFQNLKKATYQVWILKCFWSSLKIRKFCLQLLPWCCKIDAVFKPKPQVIWGCVCQEYILILWKGILHLPWFSRTGVTRLSSRPSSNPHTQDKEPQSNRRPIPKRWMSPSPLFGEGLLTSTLQICKAPWIHCNGADSPRTLPTQPHSYTQTSHSSKYRSPLIHCNSLYKKGFKKRQTALQDICWMPM